MNLFSKGLVLAFLAVVPVMAGCGDNGSPTEPEPLGRSSLRAQTDCGEYTYLAALSSALPAWEDSLETWFGNSELLGATPAFTGQATADYLTSLVPVLQQWEGAINTQLAALVVDTVANFNAATSSRQAYLSGLSSLLASWKADLETNRGRAFLPAPPVFQADETAPEIVCPADTTIACAPDSGLAVVFDVPVADDCDTAPVVTCVPESGSLFPVGETVVTCTAVDSLGNESSCSFTVTVEGSSPPEIVRATASPSVLWPPNHKFVSIGIRVDTESECDAHVECTVVNVTSNEPDNGTGDGNTSPDWIITENGGVKLRAERSGNGNGRIYTVYYVCEDEFGNTVEGSVEVVVPHDQGKKK